ncbi:MAG: helix-turn-helix domain-containing protein [Oscillospiraceae bacterium]
MIRSLGYPSRTMLYNWIKTRRTSYRSPKADDLSTQQTVFCTHQMRHVSVRHASLEEKLEIIRRCFEKGESISVVALATGYSRSAIYGWRRCLQKVIFYFI